jgi:hypothetical protein
MDITPSVINKLDNPLPKRAVLHVGLIIKKEAQEQGEDHSHKARIVVAVNKGTKRGPALSQLPYPENSVIRKELLEYPKKGKRSRKNRNHHYRSPHDILLCEELHGKEIKSRVRREPEKLKQGRLFID